MRWLDGIADLMDMNLSKLQDLEKGREACPWCAVQESVTKLNDLTTTLMSGWGGHLSDLFSLSLSCRARQVG